MQAEPVAASDALWLQDSPHNLMNIVGVYTTDTLDAATLRSVWLARVQSLDDGRRFPRFSKKVVSINGRDHWSEDPDFDIERHIFEVEPSDHWGDGSWTRERLTDYLGHLAADPLPRDRPLWQILVLQGIDKGKSAVITRIHHCMGDGMALIPIMFSIQDPIGEGAERVEPKADDPTRRVAKAKPSRAKLWLKAPLAGPFVLLRKALARPDRSALHGPRPGGEKRVAWSQPIPLAQVKAIKNALGATVNDVLMAAVAGAFRRYLEQGGEPYDARLRASVPVNVRSAGEIPKMENRFATVLLDLPLHIGDGLTRVREVKARMDALKRSVEPLVMFGAVQVVLKTLPQRASRWVADFFANKCTCVLTNVPGPQEPVAISGRRIHDMMFWVPQRAHIGIGVSILSFAGTVRLGVISDVDLMAEPHRLVEAFREELEILREVSEKPVST
ncbi:MAG: WS/DGAT domain-containing protein [Acidobacteriota bacterium]